MSLDQLHQTIGSADKKKIADRIYVMFPDKVGNIDPSLVYDLRESYDLSSNDCIVVRVGTKGK